MGFIDLAASLAAGTAKVQRLNNNGLSAQHEFNISIDMAISRRAYCAVSGFLLCIPVDVRLAAELTVCDQSRGHLLHRV